MARRKKKSKYNENNGSVLIILFVIGLFLWQIIKQNPLLSSVIIGLLITLSIWGFKTVNKQREKRRQELLSYNSESQKKWVQSMVLCVNNVLALEKYQLSTREKVTKKEAKEKFYKLFNEQETSFVYVIEEAGNQLIKIGKAKDPMKRIPKGLGAKNPYKLKTLHLIPTKSDLQVERWMHENFKTKRKNGEWFKLSHEDVAWIREGNYPLELLELINKGE